MAFTYSSAAGDISIQTQGEKELARRLKKAGANLDDLKAANLKAAQIVIPRARALAPHRTGRLRSTIRPGASKRTGVVRAGNNRKTKTGVPYAAVIHWGWPRHKIKANKFLVEAAHQTEGQWSKIYKLAIDKAIAQNT